MSYGWPGESASYCTLRGVVGETPWAALWVISPWGSPSICSHSRDVSPLWHSMDTCVNQSYVCPAQRAHPRPCSVSWPFIRMGVNMKSRHSLKSVCILSHRRQASQHLHGSDLSMSTFIFPLTALWGAHSQFSVISLCFDSLTSLTLGKGRERASGT